ncbi:MAG: aldo/keto reductase [Acidobacteriota bacterium]|nr:aldo/keto reductase [Acidobacteriota bacterium]
MEYRRLGNSGLYVSALSFGSWVTFGNQVDDTLGIDMLRTAYENGINFFDNAEVYAHGKSEEIMGNALAKLGWSRDTYTVSSKVMWGGSKPTQRGLNRKHIFDACHAAMKRLRVDYLDLYFCHRPDLRTPIEETVRAMSDLVSQGKVMYWGTSEWSAAQLNEAHGIARELGLHPPTMEQPEYNLLKRDKVEGEYAPLYGRGLGTTIWSPLASGILTGKYSKGIPDDSRMNLPGYEWLRKKVETPEGRRQIEIAGKLQAIADELETSLACMAVAWCLKNPNVSTVILGASRLSQLEENLKSLEVVPKLTDEVMGRIEEIVANKPKPPTDWLA